jgi:hypothetical protein
MLEKLISRFVTENDDQQMSLKETRLMDRISVQQRQISRLERRERETLRMVKDIVQGTRVNSHQRTMSMALCGATKSQKRHHRSYSSIKSESVEDIVCLDIVHEVHDLVETYDKKLKNSNDENMRLLRSTAQQQIPKGEQLKGCAEEKKDTQSLSPLLDQKEPRSGTPEKVLIPYIRQDVIGKPNASHVEIKEISFVVPPPQHPLTPLPPTMSAPPLSGVPLASLPPNMSAPPPPVTMLPSLPVYKFKSSIPLRSIFWDRIHPANIPQTIFVKNNIIKKSIDTPLEAAIPKLERLFAKTNLTVNVIKTETTPSTITLLDEKRSRHVAIVIKHLKLSSEEIKQAIIRMDSNMLSDSDVAFLLGAIPTADELEIIRNFSGDASMLSEAEQFFSDMEDIADELADRLEAWKFKNEFDELTGSLRADIETVTCASDELAESEQFHDVLALILAIGNFLNGDKRLVSGFKASSLPKLKDMRSKDDTNLLKVITEVMLEQMPWLMHFIDSISSVHAAARVDPSVSMKNLSALVTGIKKIQSIKIEPISEDDMFEQEITPFLKEAVHVQEKILERNAEMLDSIKELAQLFGEDENKMVDGQYSEFFSNISKFVHEFNETKELLVNKENQMYVE